MTAKKKQKLRNNEYYDTQQMFDDLYPVFGITTKTIYNFKQATCDYTEEGRQIIHKKLEKINYHILNYLMENPIPSESVEYNDNRISLYVAQNGICAITKKVLEIGDMECHHKKPRALGGTDEYSNLIYLCKDVHKVIHATDENTIRKYINKMRIGVAEIKKINALRKLVGNFEIN